MRDLLGRLAALDPDAGAAVEVIAYFDQLAESRAGLESVVRGAAVLAGVPAGFSDGGAIRIRVTPDGVPQRPSPPEPGWPSVPAGTGTLWLERSGPPGPIDAMILERAAKAARGATAPALVTVLVDASASEDARLRAARGLGLDGTLRALALASGVPVVQRVTDPLPAGRVGVGPSGAVLALPGSWAAARVALRFTAEGTEQDPGPRVVHAAELGGLAVLAGAVGPDTEPVPDVRALERAASEGPWVLTTLVTVADSTSLRAAAAELVVHHSTLQDRLDRVEHVLGWSVREPRGRLRLQLALALRRLHRTPPR
ncbi:helix-turn-helix domain-containing protein [Amycolatopsis dongchuanensis]|uniref:Helix-turn-helix domain-containing protein n=1 Tax=Amycolatopsis dongchuanensis TaxID=1070866 RepID=A0ABP9QZH3_9PSEU